MKTILIGLVFGFFSATPLMAQFFKGNTFVGGTASASFYTNVNKANASKTTDNSFSIRPSYGYVVNPKIAVGVGLGYAYDYNNFQYYLDPVNPHGKNHSNFYSIAPFFRYYLPISSSVFLALHTELSAGVGKATVGNNYTIPNSNVFVSANTNWSAVSITSKPVLIFFPSTHWGIEAGVGSIGFNQLVYNPSNSEKQTVKNFIFNAGSLFFGLSYYLKNK